MAPLTALMRQAETIVTLIINDAALRRIERDLDLAEARLLEA